jgi:hypothetical protein
MFYQCAAVDEIERKRKGIRRREWRILLRPNNPRAWFEEHLVAILTRAEEAQGGTASDGVRSLILEAPGDGSQEAYRAYTDKIGTKRPLRATEIRPRASVMIYMPEDVNMPNEPVQGKVIRVDSAKRQADVRVRLGRTEEELPGVPFKAIFGPDSMLARHDG